MWLNDVCIEKNTDESLNIPLVGESYCNDGSCALTRRGERHLAHIGAPTDIEEVIKGETKENPIVGGLFCNDGNCPRTRRGERHWVHDTVSAADEDAQDYCDVKYIGGHKASPSSTTTKMYFLR